MSFRESSIAIGLLILRVAFGCMMFVHGWQKISAFEALSKTFPDPLGVGHKLSLILAIGAEAGCSILLVIGLFTRLSVIPLVVTMIVALFIVHGDDPWKTKELAATYLAVYAALLFTGPGPFSLDHLWFSGKNKQGNSSSAK